MQHFHSAHVSRHLESAGSAPSRREPLTTIVDLASIWHEIRQGRYYVTATLCSDSRCFASLVTRRTDVLLRTEHFELLERILLGEGQKVVADDLEMGLSTLAGKAGQCLHRICREHRTSRVPGLLVLAAHAYHHRTLLPARLTRSEDDPGTCNVSVERPDRWLARELAPAEFSVAGMMFEGKTHAEMARLRGTATRTIANQVSAIFSRLHVSGRAQFLARVACSMLEEQGIVSSVRPAQ